jgi:hypothetical protein
MAVVGVAVSVGAERSLAKGYAQLVFAGANGHQTFVSGTEAQIDSLLSERRGATRPRGGYVRVFFVGPKQFPANSARYFPGVECLALDWPSPEGPCRGIGGRFRLVMLFTAKRGLTQFQHPPTRLSDLRYRGRNVRAIAGSVELALTGHGHPTSVRPQGCYALRARWKGPEAATHPTRLHLCTSGVLAGGEVYALKKGAWDWLRLNAGAP